jgi:hypothetical protein
MVERPLIVVLLSVPVRCIIVAKEIAGTLLGDFIVGLAYALYSLLTALQLRSSVPLMLLSGLFRGFVLIFSLFTSAKCAKMLFTYALSENIPLYMTICTTLVLFLTISNITRKRLAAKEIPNFGPILILAFLDLFALFITLVSLI